MRSWSAGFILAFLAIPLPEAAEPFPSEPTWIHIVVDPSPPRDPHCKAAGDLNRDGAMDLLIGSDGGDGLFWYEGPKSLSKNPSVGPRPSEAASGKERRRGDLAEPIVEEERRSITQLQPAESRRDFGIGSEFIKHRIDVGSFSTSMTAGDIDGNGSLDVIVPSSGQGSAPVFWYRNPLPGGNPVADRWEMNLIGSPRGHHDVLAADLDGDRRLDVLVRGQSSFGEKAGDAASVFRQEAGGRWTLKEIPCPHGEGIALSDIDKDGRPDIIMNGRWYKNPGGDIVKGDWKERVFTRSWTHPDAKVAAGDIDGDGEAEIVLAPSELAGQRGRISWFRRGAVPEEEWTEGIVAADVECVHHSLALADMDRDGDLDIVTARMHQGKPPQEVSVYYNADRGATWSKQVVATSGSHNIVVTDIDGDGRPDIFGANWNSAAPNGAAIEFWRNAVPAR